MRGGADIRRGQAGNVLVGAMAFMLALAALGWSYLRFASYEAESVRLRLEDMRVRWQAEAALSQGLARINRLPDPDSLELVAQDTGRYPARYTIRKLKSGNYPRWAITARVHDRSLGGPALCSLSAVAQSGTSASEFFLLEDNPGESFYFTGDTIDGPVHTNTRFAIAGSPVFLDKVFEMGGGVNQGYITHPEYRSTPILVEAKPREGPVYRFDHMASWIRKVEPAWVLKPDPGQVLEIRFLGGMLETRQRDRLVPDGWSPPLRRQLPKAGGLFVDGEVEVRGVLGKTLTLGASGNIVITDDLIYADSDPVTARPREGSGIFLGLISEKNVNVRQVQNQDTRGRGIRINASIVAMDKSFQVTNFRAHSWDMGTMHFWGTVAQVDRGGIGSLKANDTFRGFHKDWHYDRRLQTRPEALPYFPPLLSREGYMTLAPVFFSPFTWVDPDV